LKNKLSILLPLKVEMKKS